MLKEATGIRRVSLDSFLHQQNGWLFAEIIYDDNIADEELCEECGDVLHGDICPNCDLFDPERDAWTPND